MAPFPIHVMVCVGKERDKMEKELGRKIKGFAYPYDGWDGHTLELEQGGVLVSLLDHCSTKEIYHESAHAAFIGLNFIGEFPTPQTQETFCYLQGHIAEILQFVLDKSKK